MDTVDQTIVDFVTESWREGHPPSVRDVAQRIHRSPSSTHRRLVELVEQGCLESHEAAGRPTWMPRGGRWLAAGDVDPQAIRVLSGLFAEHGLMALANSAEIQRAIGYMLRALGTAYEFLIHERVLNALHTFAQEIGPPPDDRTIWLEEEPGGDLDG